MYFNEAPKTRRVDLYDFEEQFGLFKRALKENARLMTITGLRRTGKTSMLLTVLNESGFPYLIIDARVFADRAVITREDLVQALELGINDFISRQKDWARKVIDWLRGIRGVEIALEPPKVSLSWGPSTKEAVDIPQMFESLGRLAEKRKKKFVIAFDEAQEFRKLAGYDLTMILAHIYDYVPGVQIVVTGSQVGLLRDFLGDENPKAPIYGRFRVNIELPHLDEERSREFLELGFSQLKVKPSHEIIDKILRELDGVIGWLTFVGARVSRYGKIEERTLEEIFTEGARMAASELQSFFVGREIARKRYVIILGELSKSPKRWSELKSAVEVKEGRRLSNQILSGLLDKLVKAGFVKTDGMGTYSIFDPLLRRAVQSGFV
jgi:hypothetical protein